MAVECHWRGSFIDDMKSIVRKILYGVSRLWGRVFPYKVRRRLNSYRNVLYTMWVSPFLGKVGEGCSFARPLLLEGGGEKHIYIGSHTGIGHHTVLGCWERHGKDEHYDPEIIIGDSCSIGEYCHITAIRKITIGDGLLTGRFVYIGDNSHGGLSWEEAEIPPARRKLQSKGEIRIGRNVWIGDKVTILGGVTIGDNVIIGANTVVTHDIPANTVVGGSPSRIIRTLE